MPEINVDTGTIAEVPEDERLEVDDAPTGEENVDAFEDYSDIPDGQDIVILSTAGLDEED